MTAWSIGRSVILQNTKMASPPLNVTERNGNRLGERIIMNMEHMSNFTWDSSPDINLKSIQDLKQKL